MSPSTAAVAGGCRRSPGWRWSPSCLREQEGAALAEVEGTKARSETTRPATAASTPVRLLPVEDAGLRSEGGSIHGGGLSPESRNGCTTRSRRALSPAMGDTSPPPAHDASIGVHRRLVRVDLRTTVDGGKLTCVRVAAILTAPATRELTGASVQVMTGHVRRVHEATRIVATAITGRVRSGRGARTAAPVTGHVPPAPGTAGPDPRYPPGA